MYQSQQTQFKSIFIDPYNAFMSQSLFSFYRCQVSKGLSDLLKFTKLLNCDYKRIYILVYLKGLWPKDRLYPLADTYVCVHVYYMLMKVYTGTSLYMHVLPRAPNHTWMCPWSQSCAFTFICVNYISSLFIRHF